MAHDLRAPLRAIDRFSQALVEDHVERLDESGRASLERIRRNVQRMGGMIDALLQLSRLVRSTFDATEVDLSAIVQETVEAQRESDPSREVTAIVEPDVIAVGDHGLLPLLIQNLVSTRGSSPPRTPGPRSSSAWPNARATAAKGARITLADHDGGVLVTVVDDGRGFLMNDRVDRFPGQLGLPAMRERLELAGGRFGIRSAPGEGTTVEFWLPRS